MASLTMLTIFDKIWKLLNRPMTMPIATTVSLITTCDDYPEIFSTPLSTAFNSLLFGTVSSCAINAVTPDGASPLVAGGLLSLSAITVMYRAFNWLFTPRQIK